MEREALENEQKDYQAEAGRVVNRFAAMVALREVGLRFTTPAGRIACVGVLSLELVAFLPKRFRSAIVKYSM